MLVVSNQFALLPHIKRISAMLGLSKVRRAMPGLNIKREGFGAVLGLLLLVVVCVVAGSAWLMYGHYQKAHQAKQTSNAAVSTSTTVDPYADPTANWKKVDSIGGAYSIKVPDGWELTNYPGNTLNGDNISFSAGKPAIITTASNAYAGDTRKFNVVFTDKQYAAPQWQSPSQFGTEATTDFSIGSLKGKRYSIEYTQTVTGVTKGDKVYQYVFNLSGGKQLGVVYMQNSGDADNLKTVEQAIQSIVIK
jgi:hypothetical protein